MRIVVKVGTSTLTHDTGKLNLRSVLQTASEMGIPYAIVEQDFQYHLTELETLTAAYLNMKLSDPLPDEEIMLMAMQIQRILK